MNFYILMRLAWLVLIYGGDGHGSFDMDGDGAWDGNMGENEDADADTHRSNVKY